MTQKVEFYAPEGPEGDKYGYALLDDDGSCRMFDLNNRYELTGVYRMDGEQVQDGYLIRDGVAYSPMPLVPQLFFYDNLFQNITL
jgi:hypothetical protein